MEIISRFGIFGPLVLVFFHSFQILMAPIPGHIFPLLMGFLYGAFFGSIMAIIGNFLGSFTGYRIGKIGERKIFDIEKLKKLEKYKEKLKQKSIIWLTLLFIMPIPGLPKDLLCYFAGLIGIKKKDFIFSILLGRVPTDLLLVLAGAGIYKFFLPPL